MRTFKNWKSELKKKGAMALTAFMLCGSAGTAFAQNTDNMTIHDGESGDIVSKGQPTPGHVKTVTGYQTNLAVGYAANITWGDMLFVYDRGRYDSATGKLVGSFQGADENPNVGDNATKREDIEINGDRTQAGFWYGFDGKNNAVKIENLSTENVKLTAATDVTGTNKGEVEFSLYVQSSDNSEWDIVSSGDASSGVKHNPDAEDVYSDSENSWYVGAAGAPIGREFAACEFENDGSVKKADKDWVYLNITGRPGDDFMDETAYNGGGDPKTGEELGNITLSFAKTDNTPIDPANGDAVNNP